MATGSELLLTEQQHSDLCRIAQSRSLPAGYVFRAKLILMLAEGASFNAIKRQLQTTAHSLEATLPAIRTGWTGHLSSRPKAQGADPGSARPDPVRHTQKAERRIHALELPQAGRYTGRQQRRRPSRLERSWPEAAPSGTLHGQQRSGVRSQSGGHPRT